MIPAQLPHQIRRARALASAATELLEATCDDIWNLDDVQWGQLATLAKLETVPSETTRCLTLAIMRDREESHAEELQREYQIEKGKRKRSKRK